jgi:hypothetical protein
MLLLFWEKTKCATRRGLVVLSLMKGVKCDKACSPNIDALAPSELLSDEKLTQLMEAVCNFLLV